MAMPSEISVYFCMCENRCSASAQTVRMKDMKHLKPINAFYFIPSRGFITPTPFRNWITSEQDRPRNGTLTVNIQQ